MILTETLTFLSLSNPVLQYLVMVRTAVYLLFVYKPEASENTGFYGISLVLLVFLDKIGDVIPSVVSETWWKGQQRFLDATS